MKQADAIKYLAEKAGFDREVQNQAAEVGLRTRYRLGELLAELDLKPGGNGLSPTLGLSLGMSEGAARNLSSRTQAVARLSGDDFEAWIADTLSKDRELTFAGLYQYAVHGAFTQEWYTRAAFIESARTVMGQIELDPASCTAAQEVVKADRFYSLAEDGLAQEWKAETIFLNPPFGEIGPAFTAKLITAWHQFDVKEAILLVAARTDTDWFAPLFDHTLCFIEGRKVYWNPRQPSGESFASVAVHLGEDHDAFAKEFAQHGAVVRRT